MVTFHETWSFQNLIGKTKDLKLWQIVTIQFDEENIMPIFAFLIVKKEEKWSKKERRKIYMFFFSVKMTKF